MIRESINPYDARKWIEDCCHRECLVGHRDPDTGEWMRWVEGAEYSFTALSTAYVAWQKDIRAPVAPKPTPTGSLGEVLGAAGIPMRRTSGRNLRALPSVGACLEKLRSKSNG